MSYYYRDIVSHVHDHRQVQQDLVSYQFAHCMAPEEYFLWDALQGKFEKRKVNCGKCYHCTHSKSQEYVTRMLCHNEKWPFRYFITLTYDSYLPYVNSIVDKAREREFVSTLPVYDDNNTTGHKACHPCLLSREHLRNYLKRLRIAVADAYPDAPELSVFAAGEYGHTAGRPHFHLVIWSHIPIKEDLFRNAWGKIYTEVYDKKLKQNVVKPFRNQKGVAPCFVSFGNVDVCDINNPRYNEHHKSMQQIFAYVAKYVTKYTSTDENNPTFNLCRVDLAFKSFDSLTLKARYYAEKNCLHTKFHTKFTSQEFSKASAPKNPYNTRQFYRTFAPFAVQSCQYTIGKDYFDDNFEVLSRGLCKLPSFDNFVPRFPSYFRRKINERKYPLRVSKSLRSGVSLSLGNIPLIMRTLQKMAECSSSDDPEVYYKNIRESNAIYSKRLEQHGLNCRRFTECHLYDSFEKKHLYYNPCSRCFDFFDNSSGSLSLSYSLTLEDTFKKYLPGFEFLKFERLKQDLQDAAEKRALAVIELELSKDYNGLDILPFFIGAANKRIELNLRAHQRDYYAKKLGNGTMY